MLRTTKNMKDKYEKIQTCLFDLIPEKWEEIYLYASVIDDEENEQTGEMFFYYLPKGLLKKKPVNVYEIPNKFNLEEDEYIRLVKVLYNKIKLLRDEFKKTETGSLWSNITIIIENLKFKVEYNYEDLVGSDFNSYERHVIWRYNYLGIGGAQVSKKEKEILDRYILGAKTLSRKEHYEAGIYIKDVENLIGYNTEENKNDIEYMENKEHKQKKNQILLLEEELKKMKFENKK